MVSMHLSSENIGDVKPGIIWNHTFNKYIDIDSKIFYSVPTSFFVTDKRIPPPLRKLVTEAEGCLKMNYLTGASACTRKAIYEFTVLEEAVGDNYEERIKFLKTKYEHIDPDYFDVLCQIKDMTSDKVHEQSWDKWESQHLKLFLGTLKALFHEIYVEPDERRQRSSRIRSIIPDFLDWKKKDTTEGESSQEE